MSQAIQLDKRDHVWLFTIDQPEKMNALDFDANDEMTAHWREFITTKTARVAVVTGSGDKSFCAGADLKTYTMPFATSPAMQFRQKYTNGRRSGISLVRRPPLLLAKCGLCVPRRPLGLPSM